MDNITNFLNQLISNWEMVGHPAPLERFIARNGKEFTAAPFTGQRRTPKQCFQNASLLTSEEIVLTYAEGYMWRPGFPILIHHAWCVNREGEVVDPTLDRPEECQYIGITFSRRELWNELQKLGHYGILDTGLGINTDFIFRRDPELRNVLRSKGVNL